MFMNMFFLKGKSEWLKISFFLLIAWLGCLLYYHLQSVLYPYPVEFREGHQMGTTKLIIDGINPFTIGVYPRYYNSYGFFYSWVVSFFASVFGFTLEVHRIVNALFLFLSLFLIYYLSHFQIKKNPVFGLFIILLTYSLLLFRETSVCRPDTLGMFLFLCSIVYPARHKFSMNSLFVTGLLSILAFYTKPYFLIGWIAVSVYLFFYVGKIKTIVANLLFLLLFLLVGWGVYRMYPLYFYEVIFAYGKTEVLWLYSFKQLFCFVFLVFPLLFFLGNILYLRRRQTAYFSSQFQDYYVVIMAVVLILLIFPLGVNNGAFLTYYFQLLLPILSIYILIQMGEFAGRIPLFDVKVFIMSLLLVLQSGLILYFYTGVSSDLEWKSIDGYLKKKKNVLNSPVVAPLLIKDNKPVYDSGVSDFVSVFNSSPLTMYLFGYDNQILEAKKKYENNIQNQLNEKQFDALVLSSIDGIFYSGLNRDGYKLVHTYKVNLFHTSMHPIELYIFEKK